MPQKQSSPELSSLAARYGRMSSSKLMLALSRNPGQFWRDYRRICMSVVSQDEVRGNPQAKKEQTP